MNIPKIVTFKIEKRTVLYKIRVNGILFKRQFLSYTDALSHVGTLSEYFGNKTSFIEC